MIRPVAARRMPAVPALGARTGLRACVVAGLVGLCLFVAGLVTPSYAVRPMLQVSTAPQASAQVAGVTAEDDVDPLTITIESMAPSVIPESGPVRLTGTITNDSLDTWRQIKVYPRISYSPFTTSSEVELAAESDPRLPFGDRITTEGHFDAQIADLEPGESDTWSIRVPRSVLAGRIQGTEGTYQIGVQALAQSDEGRPENAVGRARTFIPLMEAGHPRVNTSVVVPVRAQVRRQDDGSLADEDTWARDLGDRGRLANIATMLGGSGDLPVSLLLDPAVLDAAQQLSEGNPARTLAAPDEQSGEGSGDTTLTMPATEWLDAITSAAEADEVLALPYGDLDIAAATTFDDRLYRQARRVANQSLESHGIASVPVVAPPSGLLPVAALNTVERASTMLMSSEAVPGELAQGDPGPSRLRVGGRTMTTYDPTLLALGEGETLNAVTARQRLLAEASVRSLAGNRQPLVVNLPSTFDPGASADEFFEGLERPFLTLRALGTNTGGRTLETDHLDYPERQENRELGAGAFLAARDLTEAGAALDGIVPGNETLASSTAREALTYVSYMQRDDALSAEQDARAAVAWIDARLSLISIDAPSFVILSSADGPFVVKVTNGLDVPVTLAIVAHTRNDLEISAPTEIELEANASRTVQLTAKAKSIGVHPVELRATDLDGRPVGEPEDMSVRSNTVGKVIWVVLGVGVGILFLAIPVRWIRRFRKSRAQA